MPGHTEAMKAAVSCDKPGERHTRDDPGWPNGETRRAAMAVTLYASESEPGELKHLSTWRKRNQPRCPE